MLFRSEATFTVAQASIDTAKVDIAPTENVYNGKARKPKITVTLNAESSDEGDEDSGEEEEGEGTEDETPEEPSAPPKVLTSKDYDVTYTPDDKVTNANTYTITIKGKGNYTGTAPTATYTINKKALEISKITAKTRTYDKTNIVELDEVVFANLEKADEGKVNLEAAKIMVSGSDAGDRKSVV